MDNVFLKYMDERFKAKEITKEERLITPSQINGPIITISREAGCSGNTVANNLCLALSRKKTDNKPDQDWQWINKQILHSTADKLNVPESKIKYIFRAEKRGMMDDVVAALSSRYYKSHTIIQKTVIKIIKNYAAKGNTIIVGRGGVIFTRNVPKSLHIKLEAPLEWRVEKISKKHNISEDEARKYILDIDLKRQKLIELLSNCKYSCNLFDLSINCSKFTSEELIQTLLKIAETKELI